MSADHVRRTDTPLALPRLVMRRAGLLALAVLLAAVVLGLLRMAADIDQEVDAAVTLADALAQLQTLPAQDDTQAMAALRALQQQEAPRHLRLQVLDAQGRPLLTLPGSTLVDRGALSWLLDLHRRWWDRADARSVAWTLPRPDGSRWTVRLQASHEGERAEAMLNLLGMLALLLAAAVGLLLVMRWNLRRALAPLQPLLAAIAGIEHGSTAAVRALPAMPVHELDAVAQALRHLAQALDEAEAQRRALGQRVLTLQEDERARLARELHDEFGQQLTALHVDAAWLARRLQGDTPALAVVQSLTGHCRHIQQELRQVLARLRPLADAADDGTPRRLHELGDLLRSLADGWARSPGAPAVQLQVDGDPALPLSGALALAVYRITQEALTNVARHAGATQAQVRLQVQPGELRWSVQDDGQGVADAAAALLRGSGLAGVRERVWALGGELQLGAAAPGAGRPGLRLSAQLPLDQ